MGARNLRMPDLRPRPLTLPPAVRRAILVHARRESPRECCGFLVGARRRVQFAVAARNALRSDVRYRIDPRFHFDLQRLLRSFTPGLEIIGTYHSHPKGRAIPSPSDLEQAYYPEWVMVIAGLGTKPELAAFRIPALKTRRVRPSPESTSVSRKNT